MNIEEINIDIECVNNVNITHDFLKEIQSNYCKSLDQVDTLLAIPLFLMTYSIMNVKKTHLSLENAIKLSFLVHEKKLDPKTMAKKLTAFFDESITAAEKNSFEDAMSQSNKLLEENSEVKESFNNIGLNALLNTWTLFETYAKEIWLKSLNDYPGLLNLKIVNSKGENDGEIFGKNITLNLLSKYNFDVSNHLGEIISMKYDFTSVDGIKKAYKDLFDLQNEELKFFESIDLNQFEIIRHILIHNSGTIDNRYLIRSKRNGEVLNTKVELNIQEISNYINSSVHCIIELIKIVEEKINNR